MTALLDALDQSQGLGHAVLVLSNVPGAGGLEKANQRGIATKTVDHRAFGGDRAAFEAEILAELARVRPDIVCLAGFLRILSPEFVAHFDGCMLNIHPSLLPKYPGLHTHDRALASGDAEAGCTVHLVTGALDAGPMLGQARVPVLPDDDADRLAARVLAQEHKLYPLVLLRFLKGQKDFVALGD